MHADTKPFSHNRPCRIEVLGPLRVTLGSGEIVTRFPRQKAARLLTFLALHPKQAQGRERLVDLFWPDLDLPAGRDSLSTTLTALRRLLRAPDVLVTTHQTVALNWDRVVTDAAEFERLASRAASGSPPQAVALEQALALYRGEACAGMYDDWAVRESERLHGLYAAVLGGWTAALDARGDTENALRAAMQWTAADPYCEAAHVRLIALHARAGQRGEARAAAKKLEHLWREEFGAPLSPTVQAKIAEALAMEPLSAPAPPLLPAVPLPAVPLPVPLDSFFGREQELGWLSDWLSADRARLVTLVGPGGMGKTRLALDFAARAADGFTSHFLSLAETDDPSQILPAIVRTLALPAGPEPLPQLAAYFASCPRSLLILDNLEQLIAAGDAAARTIQSLLLAAPGLSCLCTSRLALGLRGERLLLLDPLPLPPESQSENPAGPDLNAYAGVQLYLDRARAVRPDFSLTPENAPAVAAVCRLLDGSPLALELAASWVRLLPPRAMWDRLARQSGLIGLETRRADAPARHHSLRAALDWSWRLLPPAEQRLLARLSVFRGGWTLDAAETVCREPEALALLSSLLQASLVRVFEEKGDTRYGLLETVRHYACEQLADAGDEPTLRGFHADHFLALAQSAKLDGPEQVGELDRLEIEHDNLRAALDFCRDDAPQAERGLTLAAALMPFWRARSYLKEGEERTLALLQTPQAAGKTAARAAALNAAGTLAMLQAAYDRASAYHEDARAIFRALGDAGGEADALHGLGNIAHFDQQYPAARALFEAALARRPPNDDRGRAASWHSLGSLATREQNFSEAVASYERALCLRRRRGDTLGMAGTLGGLGQVALAQSDCAAAAGYTRQALRLFDAAGQRWTASLCLEVLGKIAFAQGQPGRAQRLLSAAMAVRERFGFAVPPAERDAKDAQVAEMRALLGESAFDAAWAEGWTFTWDEAVAYALAETPVTSA